MTFKIREIKEKDIDNGFFETLSNLSAVGDIANNKTLAIETIKKIEENSNYIIMVAEEIQSKQIIGTATLFIEQKFIHSGGKAGHIEDVATRKGHEGKGIGKQIIKRLIERAKEKGCYKIILDCDEKIINFYEKAGFKKKGIMMRIDF